MREIREHFRRMYISSVLMIGISLSSTAAQEPPALELKLLCDKTTYFLQEPIWIDILLINHEADTVMVNLPIPEGDHFRFIVVENGRDSLPYGGPMINFGGRGVMPDYHLAPGDTVYIVRDLLEGYPRSIRTTSLRDIPLSGHISITGVMWNGYYSPALEIDIVEPSEAEKAAYELWKDASGYWVGKNVIEMCGELLEKYPESVYAPSACWLLLSNYLIPFPDPDRESYYGLKILNDYPASGYTHACLHYYLGNSGSKGYSSKLDSLQGNDVPFRRRMIARNIQRGLHF